MKTITMTIDEYNAIRRLKDFAQWYIEAQDPSGEQYFMDLEDICAGQAVLAAIDSNIYNEYTTPTFEPTQDE
jgi:hypothetical protein